MSTTSVYLSRDEEQLLARLEAVNNLRRNTLLRLGLHELAARADRTGRLPILGRPIPPPEPND